METLRSETIHTSESMHSSLSCINTHHIDDELSKEKEDELLYGAGEDGDEEEALSDDSMRLRLSDDEEAEPEDILTPVSEEQKDEPQHDKSDTKPMETVEEQGSSAEKTITKNDTTRNEVQPEEHRSGNVSMDEKLVNDREKDTKMNENGVTRSHIANTSHCPWPTYESQWRFTNSPRSRPFHANRLSYTRHYYSIPDEHYRNSYYNRYDNIPYFKRGRGGGKYNSHYNESYADRKERRPPKTFIVPKPTSNELKKQSSCSTNQLHNNVNKKQTEKVKTTFEQSNSSASNKLSSNVKASSSLSRAVNEDVEPAKSKDEHVENFLASSNMSNSLEVKYEVKPINENDENMNSNDIATENPIAIDTHQDDLTNEETINSHDSNKEINKEDEMSVSDVDSGTRDPSCSTSFTNIETSLTENVEHSAEQEQSQPIKKVDISEEKLDEINASKTNLNSDKEQTVEQTSPLQEQKEESLINTNTSDCDKNDNNPESQSEVKTESSTISCEATLEKLEEQEEINEDKVSGEETGIQENDDLKKNTDGDPEDTKSKRGCSIDTLSISTNLDKNDKKLQEDELEVDSELEVEQNKSTSGPISKNRNGDKHQLNDSDKAISSLKVNKLLSSEDQLHVSNPDLHVETEGAKEKDTDFESNEHSSVMHVISKQLSHNEETICVAEESNSSTATLENVNEESNSNENLIQTDKSSSPVAATLSDVLTDTKGISGSSEKKDVDGPAASERRRRRTKKIIAAAQEVACEEDKQVKESGRRKRKTARNAEEIIRKEFLNRDSDFESSDGSDKFVIVNHKMSQDVRSSSPPSLKRTLSDTDAPSINGSVKKIKVNPEILSPEGVKKEDSCENIKNLKYVHKFFQRDLKEKLPKLKQEELEELLIQKIVETITMRGEIGRLREQARISERNQEATRARCQQLAKQIKDFEMVLNRNAADRRANNDKPTPPIKINRSVGLQVNFMTEHGMQNLRQLQQNSNIKSLNTPTTETNNNSNAPSPRKGIKVRSPRRVEPPTSGQQNVMSQNLTQTSPIVPTVTPAALVVAKPIETQHTLPLPTQSTNVQQLLPNQQVQPQQQAIVLNGKLPNQINRQSATANVTKSRANDLIDLTDEEEKTKAAISVPVVTTTITEQQINLTQKTQPCFQRVIQTIPGSVAITSQATSIRVVQPASQPTPTALVNNMNAPRLAYVMQSGVGPTRQLLIAPNSNQLQVRPVTSCNRTSFSTLTYKTGISTIANGTVRVLTTPASPNVQLNKHPAPLPDTRNYVVNPLWKLPPPAPSLKISKVANGIVLSWNMNLSDKYADIASYQLYAYQEISGIPPSTTLWKKVGDVRALPLPMACTLTQFSEGNNYYFAVRAVDTHSRKGQYSIPGNISL